MMKKLFSFLCLALSVATIAQAQITVGENTSQTIRTGNRAEQGDFGLYLGATTTMFKNIGSSTKLEALPLINLKYMVTDKLEGRLGIEWWRTTDTTKGDEFKNSEFETNFMFYPGIAYHFNRSNILDVYVGGELPIGGGNFGKKQEIEDEDDKEETVSNFRIGLGAFIGLQAYICNLPLAIGVEYGISLNNYHYGDGVMTQDGLTYSKDTSYNKFRLGNQARLTLPYFFKP